MKKIKKLGIMIAGAFLPVTALAVYEGKVPGDPFANASIEKIVLNVAKFASQVGISIAALFIIYSGYLFLTAQGSETKVEEAKKTFMYSVIGAGLLLGAWMIAEVVKSTIEGLGA